MKNTYGLPFNFKNSYLDLPRGLYALVSPTKVTAPKVAVFNYDLAKEMNLETNENSFGDIAGMLGGNKIPGGAVPLAQAYAGHQFGYFTMLGDGRAILLGEHITEKNKRFDIQLKGAGRTPYSRNGDGRATVGSMLREYLISEAIHALNIPSTRSLAVVLTGEKVERALPQPGAILTRIASSHIRTGTFEYAGNFLSKQDLMALFDYTISRHYPQLHSSVNKVEDFLKAIMERQIDLIVNWLRVGFIHGVMNTDNMSIAGETIDYGPCAFMNAYDPETVFSSIDHYGRYSFINQPDIGQWNLAVLADVLLPLTETTKGNITDALQEILKEYPGQFRKKYLSMMRMKLGFLEEHINDGLIIEELLIWMKKNKADYTNTFFYLTTDHFSQSTLYSDVYKDPTFREWLRTWEARVCLNTGGVHSARQLMMQHNPVYIPRNHLVEAALEKATWEEDYSAFDQLLHFITRPYTYDAPSSKFQQPPKEGDDGYKTFCGT